MMASQPVGMGTDPVEGDSGAVGESGVADGAAGGPDWSTGNWVVIAAFTALTLVGLALAVGGVESVVDVSVSGESDALTVPPYVYLYAGLGALGYVFTKLMVQFDEYTEWQNLEQLVGMAMRVPAAWILATGIYLLFGGVGGTDGATGARFTAGVAFLVGLYVNVALKALGSLADRILGRSPRLADE